MDWPIKEAEDCFEIFRSQCPCFFGLQSCENSEMERKRILESECERIRREKFEAILKKQEEKSGLIEPKKDLLVLPGMYLPQPPTQTLNKEEQRGSSNRNSGRRKQRPQNWRKPATQWIRKQDGASHSQ